MIKVIYIKITLCYVPFELCGCIKWLISDERLANENGTD